MSDEQWREGDAAWLRLRAWQARGDNELVASLAALGDIERLRGVLERGELDAVRLARRGRASWAEIATALGVSRQSAWEKWRELDGEADAPTTSRSSGRAVALPDLVGLGAEDARAMLRRLRLEPVAADPDGPPLNTAVHVDGAVVRQYPDSGTKLRPGARVKLWIERDGGSAGVREPRRPGPTLRADSIELELDAG